MTKASCIWAAMTNDEPDVGWASRYENPVNDELFDRAGFIVAGQAT